MAASVSTTRLCTWTHAGVGHVGTTEAKVDNSPLMKNPPDQRNLTGSNQSLEVIELDILKLFVEKIMDAALTNQGVKGVVAQLFLFVLGTCVSVLILYIVGMPQFRRDTGAAFIVLFGVNILFLQILPVKNPYVWLKWFYAVVFVLGFLGLGYRILTGNWEPIIPEYVPQ